MSATKTPPPARQYRPTPGSALVGYSIFASRWLQAPLYLGLIVAQVVYVWVFLKELWHLIDGVFFAQDHALGEAEIMLLVLGLIDVVMIANLLIMVIIGGYETFVSRINVDGHPDQPEWLSHVNANVLKVKLAMAIVGISSIHLLKTFIEVGGMPENGTTGDGTDKYTSTGVMWQVIIHCVFILSALALALIDRMSYHKVAPHEVHDGVPVAYPDARNGLAEVVGEPAQATARH
ncbi:TIGR00645 family protein [Agromyces italicus]|uniref:TIGR00645 family protein n=1 Tax=Agromyces italicus TaxID=279572 RepID=UPI0003B39A6D|nr:TIGR00645 family protein [Agromyces italicus]